MGVAEKTSGAPLPAKLAGLLREAKWLILVAVAGYLLLIFATFHRGDPGWSRSVTDGVARNAGGVVGAWVSDVALYLFGLSAYWWVALCVYVIVWGYRRLDGTRLIDRRPLVLALAGFAVLLVSSAALERLRLHSLSIELPLAPGGLIGNGVGEHPPLRIELPLAEIKQSERVQKEKQAPLFEDLPDTPLPPLKLLDDARPGGERVTPETLEFTSRLIEKKLSDFGVAVKVIAAYPGPVITRYEVEPAVGVKGSQIVNLVKDLARALSVVSIRVVETIPGKSCMGLEIPNPHRQMVRLSEILSSEAYHALHAPLALALGKDIAGNPV